MRNAHVVDFLLGLYVETVALANLFNAFIDRLHIEAALFPEAQNDVFGRSEDIHQLEVLMYHAYAEVEGVFRASDRAKLAVYIYLTLVGIVYAGEHIHKGGLAAAVFAQQGQDFSLIYIQPDFVVCKR